jgi:flagellar M-ring protein FliF
VPGSSGVLGPTTPAQTGNGDTSYKRDEASSDNAVNRVVETTERAPGAISRLSVAVLVDDQAVSAGQVTEIQNLVTAAAGVDTNRGDQLVVTRLPFDTSTADAAQSQLDALDAQKQREERTKLFTTIGAVVAVLAVLAFAYRSLTKSHVRRSSTIDLRNDGVAEAVPTRVHESATSVFDELDDESIEGVPAGVEAVATTEPAFPELPPAPAPSEEDLLVARLGNQVTNLVEKQPDEVALLLRTWLGDRRTSRR